LRLGSQRYGKEFYRLTADQAKAELNIVADLVRCQTNHAQPDRGGLADEKLLAHRSKVSYLFEYRPTQPQARGPLARENLEPDDFKDGPRGDRSESDGRSNESRLTHEASALVNELHVSGFSTVERVEVVCEACGSRYAVSLRRYEESAVCSRCWHSSPICVRW
jgi:hypothetical protein